MRKGVMQRLAVLAALLNGAASFAGPFPATEGILSKPAGTLITKAGKYGPHEADWGWMVVPENRTKPDSRRVLLGVVRQRALGAAEQPPLFELVGGPGNSNIWGIDSQPAFFQDNDLVRVGYRGVDTEQGLSCPAFGAAMARERPLSAQRIAEMRGVLRACYDKYMARGFDLDGYNLLEVVEDIEAARKAFGYDKIDILAVSWGSQVAYSYCTAYPRHVNRAVFIGAGSRERGLIRLWEPAVVDELLQEYAKRWAQDAQSTGRVSDILVTIKSVLAGLPRKWNEVNIDPDKVRLAMFYLLRETRDAALVLDAFATAQEGDLGGLALLSWGYDQDVGKKEHEFFGEFFCKAVTLGLDPATDFAQEMEPAGSLLGSPAAKLLWGAASQGGWPVTQLPRETLALRDVDVPTLVIMGNLDAAAPVRFVKEELMLHLKRGELVVLSDMGHTDVVRLQYPAFEHLALRFLREGVVDSSKYVPNRIDFTPDEPLTAQAKKMFAGERP